MNLNLSPRLTNVNLQVQVQVSSITAVYRGQIRDGGLLRWQIILSKREVFLTKQAQYQFNSVKQMNQRLKSYTSGILYLPKQTFVE